MGRDTEPEGIQEPAVSGTLSVAIENLGDPSKSPEISNNFKKVIFRISGPGYVPDHIVVDYSVKDEKL